MKESLVLESPAKVNLRLEILKKREDGYHELKTIFQKISLHDTLRFSLRKGEGFLSRQTILVFLSERLISFIERLSLYWRGQVTREESQLRSRKEFLSGLV